MEDFRSDILGVGIFSGLLERYSYILSTVRYMEDFNKYMLLIIVRENIVRLLLLSFSLLKSVQKQRIGIEDIYRLFVLGLVVVVVFDYGFFFILFSLSYKFVDIVYNLYEKIYNFDINSINRVSLNKFVEE